MDDVELLLAARRMKTWTREWRELVVNLPADEAKLIVELVALLDARPADEDEGTGQTV